MLTKRTLVIFFIALIAFEISSGFSRTTFDSFVELAYAWLHGHLWLAHPSQGIAFNDVVYRGRSYVIEGPMSAVQLLPVVAVFGLHANQTMVCVLDAAIAVAAMDVALARMSVAPAIRNWALALLAFGSALWYCAALGSVWVFGSVAGTMFVALALAELFGRRRYWLVGLLVACAGLSRAPMLLGAVPIVTWGVVGQPAAARGRALGSLLAGFVPLYAAYAAYNVARWGTPFDLGYVLFARQFDMGYVTYAHLDPATAQPVGFPFGLRFLPYNLYTTFLLPPDISKAFPWIRPTAYGVALTFTAPALALAFAARWGKETIACWIAALAAAAPTMFYYMNGWTQLGVRHSLDYEVFLIPLVARGLTRFPKPAAFALVGYSIAANAYLMAYAWAFATTSGIPI